MSAHIRIVSLVPSLTELLCSMGLGPRLVGRTGFCIHPRDLLASVPKVGGTKDVDIDRVRALKPTHLVVNVDENERPVVESLAQFVPNVLVTHPIEVRDNLAVYQQFGEAFGCAGEARRHADLLEAQLQACRARTWSAQRVLYLIWKSPWMTVSTPTYISRTLAEVGWQTVAPDSERRYPELDPQALPAFDRVLLSTEPWRFGPRDVAALRDCPLLEGRPVDLIDGEMTSWYGSRAIRGLEYLRQFREALDHAH